MVNKENAHTTCPHDMVVHHIDGVRSNNNIDNLKHVTQAENVRHSYNLGRRNQIEGRPLGAHVWREFESQVEAALELNLSQSAISMCCTQRIRQAGGYEFRFAYEAARGASTNEAWGDEEWRDEEWRDVILPPKLLGLMRTRRS